MQRADEKDFKMTGLKARVIAFYLPQFHPIPENDLWWGTGFTEWTNVAKAKPLFSGHYQPRIPADLGFYDLRVPETRLAQAEIAQAYGIEGFCYWHYWFAGEQLLERPFNDVLRTKEPKFPFCLAWANESWTGIWHGAPNRLLRAQTYPGFNDHQVHFYKLLQAFADARYMTVEGKPIFVIYRPESIPEVDRVAEFWRGLAIRSGLSGLHLVAYLHAGEFLSWRPQDHGFDAALVANQERIMDIADGLSQEFAANWPRHAGSEHSISRPYIVQFMSSGTQRLFRTLFMRNHWILNTIRVSFQTGITHRALGSMAWSCMTRHPSCFEPRYALQRRGSDRCHMIGELFS